MNKALPSVLISRVERRLAAELFGLERPRSCVICVLLKKSNDLMGHRCRKSVRIVERSTRPISLLVKKRSPMAAMLFKESNTKLEYVPTNVGTSSSALLDGPMDPRCFQKRTFMMI